VKLLQKNGLGKDGSQEGFLLARSQAQGFFIWRRMDFGRKEEGKSLCIYIPVSILAVVFDIISSFITPQ
jgi:hypothetical protein